MKTTVTKTQTELSNLLRLHTYTDFENVFAGRLRSLKQDKKQITALIEGSYGCDFFF